MIFFNISKRKLNQTCARKYTQGNDGEKQQMIIFVETFSVKMENVGGSEDLLLKLQFKVLGQLRAIFLPLLSVERVVFNVF